jgi:translation initiation factor 2 alpha subunit (eIF-2alpha)
MAERKPEWPEVGDLVIATMESVTTYGAYAKFDEYDEQGLLRVSETQRGSIRRKLQTGRGSSAESLPKRSLKHCQSWRSESL